jgi:xylulokinase
MTYLLGIDLGSTSLKAVAFDIHGNIQASSSRPTLESRPDPDHPEWSYWMPENIWGGTASAIQDVVNELGDPKEIAAVAVTGMGMDGLPIDANGEWLYPFISWHDTRTYKQHQWWMDNVGPERIYEISGHAALHINSINRIMWMLEHEPEIMSRADKWLLIEDFLNFMLCGVKASDYSMAATTQVFDCTKLDWSDELIKLSGASKSLFPPLFPSGTILGEVQDAASKQTGLRVGTPVVLGGHDYLMGALAAGAMESGTMVDITGSWEIVMAQTDKPILTADVYHTGVVWDPHVIKEKYCLFIDAVAGSMIEWYRSQFCKSEEIQAEQQGRIIWDILMEQAAESMPGSGGVTFLPHLSGCTSPVKDPKSYGAFVGISHSSTQSMFIRAVVEGLNYQSRQMIETIEAIGGDYTNLRAIGGTTRNTFWMQNKADVIGRPIEIPNIDEATCLGTAIKAGIGVGMYKDDSDAFKQTYHSGHSVEPDVKVAEKYEEYYQEIYKPLYLALKSTNHAIFDHFRG